MRAWMWVRAVWLTVGLVVACGCGGRLTGADADMTDGTEAARALLAPLAPDVLPAPPPDPSNHHADDGAAAALGQKIFFDRGFSGRLLEGDDDGTPGTLGMQGQSGRVACADCHVATAGFLDSRSLPSHAVSLAAGWTMRRSPSLLDVGQSGIVMWDGRRDALWNQAFGPLEHANEMNSSRLYAAEQIFQRYKPDYEAIFGALPALDDTTRFPVLSADETGCSELDGVSACAGAQRGSPGDGAEYDQLSDADRDALTRVWVNVGKSLAAYERKLSCGAGRFDAWMHGDATALSDSEQRGAVLFAGKAHCLDCHSGPYFSDEKFHVTGLMPVTVAAVVFDSPDPGASSGLADDLADPLNTKGAYSDGDPDRLPASVDPALANAFRTPKLRCVSERPAFMHTGQLLTLGQVVAFFSRGGDGRSNELVKLDLVDTEQADLVAFLKTLDGPGPDQSLLAP